MDIKTELEKESLSPINRLVRFCLGNKLVTGLFAGAIIVLTSYSIHYTKLYEWCPA